jgi:hypothetical protein
MPSYAALISTQDDRDRTDPAQAEEMADYGAFGAEAKEALGGFYLLECADLDEAVRLAETIPGVWRGATIELRPVVPMPAG